MNAQQVDEIARGVFSQLPHPDSASGTLCPTEKIARCSKHNIIGRHYDKPWWTPGQMCRGQLPHRLCNAPIVTHVIDGRVVLEPHISHEIPPPDPMDWAVFGQLLMATKAHLFWNGGQWRAELRPHYGMDDDPRIALLQAVAMMLKEQH